MGSQGFVESFAVKDGREALLVNRICLTDEEQTKYLSRQELEELFAKSTINGKQKCIVYNGKLTSGLRMLSDDELVQWYKDIAKENFADIVQSAQRSFDRNYGTFERLVNNASIEDIPENFHIVDNVIIVNGDDDNMTMQSVSVRFMSPDRYKVGVRSVPINKYTLEQLKGATKIHDAKEPRINPRLNPNIDVSEINSAKRLVMEMKSSK